MHYKNGREAKVGDKVLVPNGNYTFVGIVASVQPGATSCNLQAVPLIGGSGAQSATASECLSLDDVLSATIPDSTKAPPVENARVAEGCEKFSPILGDGENLGVTLGNLATTAQQLCGAIEALPASEQQTNVSLMAAGLRTELHRLAQ